MIRFWKQNKKLKDNEVKLKDIEVAQSDVETQKSEISLANLYKEEMLKVINLLKESETRNLGNQKEMMTTLKTLDNRMERMELKVGDIESYLNGPYHRYLADKEQEQAQHEQKEAQ
jgi:hypothetical protein